MTIAENLIKARGDMTQTELAIQSGVSQKTVSAIEKGRIKFPTYQTAQKLATVLNVRAELFLEVPCDDLKTKQESVSKIDQLRAQLKGAKKVGG